MDKNTDDVLDQSLIQNSNCNSNTESKSNTRNNISTLHNDSLDNYLLAGDKTRREIKKPLRYSNFSINIFDLSNTSMIVYALSIANELDDNDLKTYKDVILSTNANNWKLAM